MAEVLIYFLSAMTTSILKGYVDLELLIVSFKLSTFVIIVALMYRLIF